MPYNIKYNRLLRRKIDNCKNVKWKIITLVREPIAKEISTLFQVGAKVNRNLIDETGEFDVSLVLKYFNDRFDKFDESIDNANLWFDKEIRRVFNVDVYEYPFDQEKGYTMIHEKNIDLLILRLENLDNIF